MFWNKKGVYPNNMFFQTKLFGQKKIMPEENKDIAQDLLVPVSLERSSSVWMERSTPAPEDGEHTASGYEPSSDEEKQDDSFIVEGKATFNTSGTRDTELSLETNPQLFIALADHQTRDGGDGPEENILDNQEMQLSILKRLPIKDEKSWKEIVETLAQEYKHTHQSG